MPVNVWVYILLRTDGSYYVGSHRGEDVGVRVAQHQAGNGGDYTRRRLPVSLIWAENFQQITDAIAVERQIKGWSRAKKEALIRGDWRSIVAKSRRRGGEPRPLRAASPPPQDEDL